MKILKKIKHKIWILAVMINLKYKKSLYRFFPKHNSLFDKNLGNKYKCDIKIMGVPKRKESIKRLQKELNLTDRDVFLDTKYRQSPMWTWKYTMKMKHTDGITHRIVLQDDALVCDDLLHFANMLVNQYPNAIFDLYNNAKDETMSNFLLSKYSCFRLNEVIGGVGFIIPLNIYDEMMDFYYKYFPDYEGDDGYIMSWACMNNYPVYAFWPGLVSEESKDSILGHSKETKQEPICDNPLKHNWHNFTDVWIYDNTREWTVWDYTPTYCEEITEEEKLKLE